MSNTRSTYASPAKDRFRRSKRAASRPTRCHSCVTHSRNQEDTEGHQRTRRPVRLSTGGHERKRRTLEDKTYGPFGVVRARVRIPDPDQLLNSESVA